MKILIRHWNYITVRCTYTIIEGNIYISSNIYDTVKRSQPTKDIFIVLFQHRLEFILILLK